MNTAESLIVLAQQFDVAALDHKGWQGILKYDDSGRPNSRAIASPLSSEIDGDPKGMAAWKRLMERVNILMDDLGLPWAEDPSGRWFCAIEKFFPYAGKVGPGDSLILHDLFTLSASTCRRMAEAVEAAEKRADA